MVLLLNSDRSEALGEKIWGIFIALVMWGVQREYMQGFQIISVFFTAFKLFLISSFYLPQWCHCNCTEFFVYNKNSENKPLIFAFLECQSNFLRLLLNLCKYFSRRFLSTLVHSSIWGEHGNTTYINTGKLNFVKNGKNMKPVFQGSIRNSCHWACVFVYVCM